MLKSITRLIIGGVLIGYDSLAQQIQNWEQQSAPQAPEYPEPNALGDYALQQQEHLIQEQLTGNVPGEAPISHLDQRQETIKHATPSNQRFSSDL